MNDRLLTDGEMIEAVIKTCNVEIDVDDMDRAIAKAQDAKTRELTLKEVGEWLTRKVYADGLLIPHHIVEALKRGEMPDSKGKGKLLYIYGEFPKGEFDVMYGFADGMFKIHEGMKLVRELKKAEIHSSLEVR